MGRWKSRKSRRGSKSKKTTEANGRRAGGRGGSLSSSTAADHPVAVPNGAFAKEEKAGWLQKWTNYIKRWFVLDSNGILSYYRNQHEVGESCRGSINLQEARIHADKDTNNIVIAASSQTFHLKAQNDVDRQNWLQALELARHRAVKAAESDEEDEAQLGTIGGTAALDSGTKLLHGKLESLKNAQQLVLKQGTELLRCLESPDVDKNLVHERSGLFKITTSACVKAAEEFVELSEREARRLHRAVALEHEQRVRLQEQLEQLARQHSALERAATYRNSASKNIPPPHEMLRSVLERIEIAFSVSSDDLDEFHDAEEDFHTDDRERRKSGSSRQGSVSEEDALFSAEIVTPATDSSRPTVARLPASSISSVVSTTGKAVRQRRAAVPPRPDLPLNLWSIMRNCIGKELSKIPMPVNFSEPLSVLQRITEDLEYASLLETAVSLPPLEQMAYVAAYAVSSYSTTGNRTTKPFNPLLGETYECDRMEDLGWRSFTEQVSHHPPAAAHHAEGRGWTMYQDFTMTSRFRGKYLSVIPVGCTHVVFADGNHYSYKKITTTVHNIIVGKLWIDNHGDMEITNHKTGDKCTLKWIPYSYFSRDPPRRVTGLIKDKTGVVRYLVQGTWDKHMDMLKVTKQSGSGDKLKLETEEAVRIWTVNPPYPGSDTMHHFTKLAIELNEPEDGVAPTDSRLRPDQRLMEDGFWDEANKKKQEIEERQRAVRKRREAEAEKALAAGQAYEEYEPVWFRKTQDELTGTLMHVFNGDYWEAKKKHDWKKCPDIYG